MTCWAYLKGTSPSPKLNSIVLCQTDAEDIDSQMEEAILWGFNYIVMLYLRIVLTKFNGMIFIDYTRVLKAVNKYCTNSRLFHQFCYNITLIINKTEYIYIYQRVFIECLSLKLAVHRLRVGIFSIELVLF